MSKSVEGSLSRFELGYVGGLLGSPHKSLRAMQAEGWLEGSVRQNCGRLGQELYPYRSGLVERIQQAPTKGYLVVDLHPIEHNGQNMEGTHKVYSSADKASFWGHSLVSWGLVYPHQEVYPLGLSPFPNQAMATQDYPQLTPSEAMLNGVAELVELGYRMEAVVADAQFTTRLGLRSLKYLKTPFIGRFRTNAWISYRGKPIQVKQLATQYPPGKAHYYKRFKCYAKRLRVELESVGFLDLILIWKPQGHDFELMTLISTLEAGLQTILQAWKLRWDLEVAHRLYKQNLGISACQCRNFAAQLKHYDLTLTAFHRCRNLKIQHPQFTWRQAQSQAAAAIRDHLLTELIPQSA